MIKKSLFILVMFFLIIFCVFSIFFEKEEKKEFNRSLVESKNKNDLPSIATVTQKESSYQADCAVTNPIFTGVAAPEFDDMRVKELTGRAFNDINALVSEAENDPFANIAIYKMTSSCFTSDLKHRRKIIGDICPTTASVIPIRFTNLELLQKAAELGSEQAKLMYALNAPITSDYMKGDTSQEGRKYSQEILARAQEFGDSAARAGIPDALRYMSRVHELGLFGVKDIQRAYVYSLPLKILGTKEDIAQIENIGARLNSDMKKGAEIKAFGCKNIQLNNLKSPF